MDYWNIFLKVQSHNRGKLVNRYRVIHVVQYLGRRIRRFPVSLKTSSAHSRILRGILLDKSAAADERITRVFAILGSPFLPVVADLWLQKVLLLLLVYNQMVFILAIAGIIYLSRRIRFQSCSCLEDGATDDEHDD